MIDPGSYLHGLGPGTFSAPTVPGSFLQALVINQRAQSATCTIMDGDAVVATVDCSGQGNVPAPLLVPYGLKLQSAPLSMVIAGKADVTLIYKSLSGVGFLT